MSKAHTDADWSAVSECFGALCIGFDTPRSLKAYLLAKHKEYQQLAEFRIDPKEYTTADRFAIDYAVTNFIRKNKDIPLPIENRKVAALREFERTERTCQKTNERLDSYLSGNLKIPPNVERILHSAQRKIGRLLGGNLSLDNGPYFWGPGATYDVSRRSAYPDTKHTSLPLCVTGGAWKHVSKLINDDLHWKSAIISTNVDYKGIIWKIIPGGRLALVAKDALIDRTVLIEPGMNVLPQKRIGDQIRALLKTVGVDLDDQTRNQTLAGLAKDLGLATVDLRSASSLISYMVVRLLLGPDDFILLNELRSHWYQDLDDKWHKLEMFSSMGNGFTFELESLIFWAITASITEDLGRRIFGVFGDDIILHKEGYSDLVDVFTFLGFEVNTSKTYSEGLFYESCGKHFFDGYDVTPVYQKSAPADGDSARRMGNRLLRLAHRLRSDGTLDPRVKSAWKRWVRHWDVHPEEFGPFVGEGDGYWESDSSYYSNRISYGPWGRRCLVKCYSEVTKEIPSNDNAMYSIWLMGTDFCNNEENELFEYCRPPEGIKRALKKLIAYKESRISITRKRGAVQYSYNSSPMIGFINSRVETRRLRAFRNVLVGHNEVLEAW